MNQLTKNHKVYIYFQWVLLGLLTGVLGASLFIFVRHFEYLRLNGYIGQPRFHHSPGSQLMLPGQIQDWMTFHYINLVFNLPSGYLQTQLNIIDKRYPNLTIAAAAKDQKISQNLLLQRVISAVQSNLNKPLSP